MRPFVLTQVCGTFQEPLGSIPKVPWSLLHYHAYSILSLGVAMQDVNDCVVIFSEGFVVMEQPLVQNKRTRQVVHYVDINTVSVLLGKTGTEAPIGIPYNASGECGRTINELDFSRMFRAHENMETKLFGDGSFDDGEVRLCIRESANRIAIDKPKEAPSGCLVTFV
jgi:hypothetical protein